MIAEMRDVYPYFGGSIHEIFAVGNRIFLVVYGYGSHDILPFCGGCVDTI